MEEKAAVFDAQHYPEGVNANFLTDNSEELQEKYAGPKGLFEDPEGRDIARNVKEILAALPDLTGQVIADIGAGTGIFLTDLNARVGEHGQVLAVEISEGFLKMLDNKIKKEGLSRCQLIKGTDKEPNLPPSTVDVAFICDVYHHIEYPITYMRRVLDSMKSGAMLIVIDFHRIPEKIWSRPPNWVLEHVRAGQEVFTAEIVEAGFVLEKEITIETLKENYFLIFRKP